MHFNKYLCRLLELGWKHMMTALHQFIWDDFFYQHLFSHSSYLAKYVKSDFCRNFLQNPKILNRISTWDPIQCSYTCAIHLYFVCSQHSAIFKWEMLLHTFCMLQAGCTAWISIAVCTSTPWSNFIKATQICIYVHIQTCVYVAN